MRKYILLALISVLLCSCGVKKISTKTNITDKTEIKKDSTKITTGSETFTIDKTKKITITEEVTESISEIRDSTGRVISPAKTVTKKRQISATDNNVALTVRDSCSSTKISETKKADVISSTSEVVRSKPFAWGWVVFWGGVIVVIRVAVRRYLRF